jgi:hypothetical protein
MTTERKYLAAFRRATKGINALSVGAYPQDMCKACSGTGKLDDDHENDDNCDDCNGKGRTCDCPDCADYDPEAGDEGSFSWSDCDTCNQSLGGDRHAAHGLINTKPRTKRTTLIHLSVCTDCLLFIANGDLPGDPS